VKPVSCGFRFPANWENAANFLILAVSASGSLGNALFMLTDLAEFPTEGCGEFFVSSAGLAGISNPTSKEFWKASEKRILQLPGPFVAGAKKNRAFFSNFRGATAEIENS
jgi:hypothetical protein